MTQPSARTRILDKLRAVSVTPLACPDVSGFYAAPASDADTRSRRLVQQLTTAMAEVHQIPRSALADCLSQVIASKQLRSVAIGPELLSDTVLCKALATQTDIVPVTVSHAAQTALFQTIDAGLTLTHGGIAETGTLVLQSSSVAPRLLSLVPPVHIAILQASRIDDRLIDMMQREGWSAGLPTNVVLVSSPSKTADIQQTLAYGAHGPKQLVVIVLEDQ